MPYLDALRGIAVLMVVAYHGFFWSHRLDQASGLSRFLLLATKPGWLGVDLFFVLSGFLITGILVDARERPDFFRWFYCRRALRILPVYLVLLLLLLSAGVIGVQFAIMAGLFVANLSPLFGVALEYGPLWSLAVEEQFYLVWPAAVRRLSRDALVRLSITVVGGAPVLRWLSWTQGTQEGLYFYTWFTVDGLAMGALLALYLQRPRSSGRDATRVGVTCVVAGALLLAAGAPFGILTRKAGLGAALQYTPWCLMFTGIISAFSARGNEAAPRSRIRRLLGYFGEISYGLYLIHLLAFMTYDAGIRFFFPDRAQTDSRLGPMLVRFVVSVGGAVVIAHVSRHTLEEWFLARKDVWSEPATSGQRSAPRRLDSP
jgi:peptidoglycan/LPS O-acetylase OafA/YrhL